MVASTTALVAVLVLSGLHLERSPLDLSSAEGATAVYSLGAGLTYVFTLVAGVLALETLRLSGGIEDLRPANAPWLIRELR